MRLEMELLDVKNVEFGAVTRFSDGLLTVNKDELITLLSSDDRIEVSGIEIARPGERVRITNVLDAIEPRVKTDPLNYFPGMLGWLERVGSGTTRTLRGACVLEIGAIEGFYGHLVDMDGEAARLSTYARTNNICLLTKPAQGCASLEYGLALKQAGLRASVYLAKSTLGASPDEKEIFDLDLASSTSELPRVAYLCQLHSHGDSREPFIYGDNTRRYYPTVFHPNEVLDGAIVCGAYNISAAFKNHTFGYLNNPIIRGLYERHGKEVNFAGVVIAPEPTSMSEIKRTSFMAASLVKNVLHADGVIITKEGGGHTDVDLMQNCEECESLGVATVLLDNEWLGPDGSGEFPLLAISSKADAMVSVGNTDGIIDLPAMDTVLGGATMPDFAGRLDKSVHIPVRFIANAISQLGLTPLVAESR
jgi:glycine reductase complex component B subunit alpha and beta